MSFERTIRVAGKGEKIAAIRMIDEDGPELLRLKPGDELRVGNWRVEMHGQDGAFEKFRSAELVGVFDWVDGRGKLRDPKGERFSLFLEKAGFFSFETPELTQWAVSGK